MLSTLKLLITACSIRAIPNESTTRSAFAADVIAHNATMIIIYFLIFRIILKVYIISILSQAYTAISVVATTGNVY